MKAIAIALIFVLAAAALGAEEITYPVSAETAERMQWISVGAFAGFTVALIVAGILAPRASEWKVVDGEYVRVR